MGVVEPDIIFLKDYSGCWLGIVGQESEVRRPVEKLLP